MSSILALLREERPIILNIALIERHLIESSGAQRGYTLYILRVNY